MSGSTRVPGTAEAGTKEFAHPAPAAFFLPVERERFAGQGSHKMRIQTSAR